MLESDLWLTEIRQTICVGVFNCEIVSRSGLRTQIASAFLNINYIKQLELST